MNLQKSFTKKISFVLIVSILSLNLSFLTVPKKADAIWGVGDISFDPAVFGEMLYEFGEKLVDAAVAAAAKRAARIVIDQITQATVDWINGGFNGNPAYVADFNKFMTGEGGVVDQTVGDFFANSDLNFLCDPFRAQVLLALQLESGLRKQIGCTFSGVTRNINNAVNNSGVNVNVNVSNFTNNGGWDSWLKQTLQPQNNPVGAYLIAKDNLDAQIKTAKGNATLELTVGQGALSFNRCIDVYYAGVNEIGRSQEYTKGHRLSGTVPAGTTKTDSRCAVKTPGATITTMLGFKATSDSRMNELIGSLSDGIDAIFNALVNSLVDRAVNQLKKGVLDNNITINSNYNSAINTGYTDSINNFNSKISDSNNRVWDAINDPFGTSTLPIFSSETIANPYSTTSGSGATSTGGYYSGTTGGYSGGESSGGYYSMLAQAQNNSAILIKSLLKSELAYQNNYKIAKNILTQARGVFATSSACNMGYNRSDYILRSSLIRSNVITNIDGVSDSNRDIASIPWNLEIIKAALTDSDANVAILNKAASDVGGAGSISAITDAMIPVNSTSFNTDPESKMVENIKTWLRGVQGMYNSLLCPINLTKILQITSVATSTAK